MQAREFFYLIWHGKRFPLATRISKPLWLNPRRH